MAITRPGYYYGAPNNAEPTGNPVPGEQEKCLTPSIDPYVSEQDHWTVDRLPSAGKKQFSENVHQYIGQLGKDYGVTVPGEIHGEDGKSTIINLPVVFHVDLSELAEAIRKLGEIDE